MITLPALRGDDPLGFLAAVGLVSLSEQGELSPLRLAWTGLAPVATVEGAWPDLDALADELASAFTRIRAGGVLPGVGDDLPLPAAGTTDPMRMTPEEIAGLYADAHRAWITGEPWRARWLIALTAQTAMRDDTRRDVVLTPFYAPTGRMTMRGSIFDSAVRGVEQVEGPGDALTGWRRTAYDGANFDERSKRDGAVTTDGQADNRGAPSPTWLAAMAIRLFPVVDRGTAADAVGWMRVRLYQGYTARSLIWPIWSEALGPPEVRTLLAHPATRPTGRRREGFSFHDRQLEGLGVTGVYGSSRRTLTQGDGPLGPARRLWPPDPTPDGAG